MPVQQYMSVDSYRPTRKTDYCRCNCPCSHTSDKSLKYTLYAVSVPSAKLTLHSPQDIITFQTYHQPSLFYNRRIEQKLLHTFMTYKFDFCNALLVNLSGRCFEKLLGSFCDGALSW
jgi:hypothetical protein